MHKLIILSALVVLGCEQAVAPEPVKIIPDHLIEFAGWNNCAQVSNFYELNAGPVDPPYVYGYTSEKGVDSDDYYDSAVFWCQRNEHGKIKYLLTFQFKSSENELAKCPFQIEFGDVPSGISVFRDKSFSLKGFDYLKDSKKRFSSNAKLKHNAIKIGYGVSALFYCHNGDWLVLGRD